MPATLDDATRYILGSVLQSAGGEALYPDALVPMGLDVGGDEFPRRGQRNAQPASPLAADFPDADTTNWSSEPRPTVTAWRGADMDAYYLDGQTWRHCQTDAEWAVSP